MIDTIIKSFDIWTDAQGVKSKGRVRSVNNISLEGVLCLRKLILRLAFSGRLVQQKQKEVSAVELLKQIKAKENKSILPVSSPEIPYSIPDSWQWCRIGDITNHNSGKTLDNGRNKGELREYITTSNLYWGFFKLQGLRTMRLEEEELERCTAIKGDLLICEGGEAGRAAVWEKEEPICFQNHIHRVRPLHGIDSHYLFFYMMKIFHSGEIHTYRKGVGIHNLSGKALSSIVIPLAPISEQKRIVAKVQELIALCDQLEEVQTSNLKTHQALVRTLLETLTQAKDADELQIAWELLSPHFDTLFCTEDSIDQLKQTILQLAIMGRLVKQDSNDKPASELMKKIEKERGKLVKEGEIKREKKLPEISDDEKPFELPKGWEWVRLGEVTNYGILQKAEPEDVENDTWVLELEDVEKGSSKLLQKIRASDKQFQSSKNRFYKGDVIYGKLRPYLDKVLIADEEGVCTTEMIPIRGYLNIIPEYLRLVLKTTYFIDYATRSTHGMNLPRLGTDKARLALFPLVSENEQYKIVSKVNNLFLLCDSLKNSLSKVQEIKSSLSKTIAENAIS